MKILLATSNPYKLEEVRAILGLGGFEVVGLDTIARPVTEPVEDASTFAGNARLKATGYAREIGIRCMADDSGLVVDALGGEPGVFSARYAGKGTTRKERDTANNTLLLERLEGIPEKSRSARFVCAVCVADPCGTVVAESEGYFEGVITEVPRGNNGFGYDPLLYLPDVGKTSAELSSEEKNLRSHRGQAVRQVLRQIEQ